MSNPANLPARLPARLPSLSPLSFALGIGAATLVLVAIGQIAPSVVQMAEGVPKLVNRVSRMAPPNIGPGLP